MHNFATFAHQRLVENAFLCCAVGSTHSQVKEGQIEGGGTQYSLHLPSTDATPALLYQENSGQWSLCSGVLSLSSALRKRSELYGTAPARAELGWRGDGRVEGNPGPGAPRVRCAETSVDTPTLCSKHRIFAS